MVATMSPSPAALADGRPPSASCRCGHCRPCLAAALRTAQEQLAQQTTARQLAEERSAALERQIDAQQREMLVLQEENLRLGKENVSARISVERMAGLFE